MIKNVGLIRFNAEMGRQEGERYWREVHGLLGTKVPKIARYDQSHLADSVPEGMSTGQGELPVDGYAALWWADQTAFDESTATPEFTTLGEDTANFLDLSRTSTAFVDERVIKDGERAPIKLTSFATFRSDMSKEEASRYWTETHGALTLEASGFTRYVQNHVIRDPAPDGAPLTFDGYAEHWFRTKEDLARAVSSPEWQRLIEDGRKLFEMDKLSVAIFKEIVFIS